MVFAGIYLRHYSYGRLKSLSSYINYGIARTSQGNDWTLISLLLHISV